MKSEVFSVVPDAPCQDGAQQPFAQSTQGKAAPLQGDGGYAKSSRQSGRTKLGHIRIKGAQVAFAGGPSAALGV
jgi:hypothetical protein